MLHVPRHAPDPEGREGAAGASAASCAIAGGRRRTQRRPCPPRTPAALASASCLRDLAERGLHRAQGPAPRTAAVARTRRLPARPPASRRVGRRHASRTCAGRCRGQETLEATPVEKACLGGRATDEQHCFSSRHAGRCLDDASPTASGHRPRTDGGEGTGKWLPLAKDDRGPHR